MKLDGAVFFNGEFSTPWCAREPDSCTMATYLSVPSKHVIIFHLVTEGTAYVSLEHDTRRVPLGPGDIVVLPHGQAHVMGNGQYPRSGIWAMAGGYAALLRRPR